MFTLHSTSNIKGQKDQTNASKLGQINTDPETVKPRFVCCLTACDILVTNEWHLNIFHIHNFTNSTQLAERFEVLF